MKDNKISCVDCGHTYIKASMHWGAKGSNSFGYVCQSCWDKRGAQWIL